MKQSDIYTRLKRKNEESVSQSFGNERYASYIQEQVNTQDALGFTLTTQESVSIRHHETKQNARTADQGRLLSSPKFLRLAIPPFPNPARFPSSAMSATLSSLTPSPPLLSHHGIPTRAGHIPTSGRRHQPRHRPRRSPYRCP